MTGIKGMHNIGRPTKEESKKAKFRQHSFYFPLRLEDVWIEFNLICINKIKKYPYIERAKSVILRRLLFDFVLKHTKKDKVKQIISNYMKQENNYIKKLSSLNKDNKVSASTTKKLSVID